MRTRLSFLLALLAALGTACGKSEPTASPGAGGKAPTSAPIPGLGRYHRQTSTASGAAGRAFDQGLVLYYAYDHPAAVASFARAAEAEPAFAMAWWGVSLANGPYINDPVLDPEHAAAAWAALEKARERIATASTVERDLIEALARRWSPDPAADRAPLDRAYADAMAAAFSAHPDDPDVAALYAESLLDMHPWDLWTHDGRPQPGTEAMIAALDRALSVSPDHPGANHFLIHAWEASPTPERALAAADRLRDLAPAAGHLVHMASHVYARVGRWEDAAEANRRAIDAERTPVAGPYPPAFQASRSLHERQFLSFAAAMEGRSAEAIGAARQAIAGVRPERMEAPEHAAMLDSSFAMPVVTLVWFGKWAEALAEPEPLPTLPIARAVRRWGRGMALAATGKPDEAAAERDAMEAETARVDPRETWGLNDPKAVLDVAKAILDARILEASGRTAEAIAALEAGATLEDALRYSPPPDWPLPVRHHLGAALLAAGRAPEAEAVYREALRRNPENGWALLGLSLALDKQGSAEAATVRARFTKAWSRADVRLASSRF